MTDPIPVFILTQSPIPDSLIGRLRAVSPRLRILQRTAETLEELGEAWAEVEVLYTTRLLPSPEQAPRLRWVQGHFAGVDHVIGHPLIPHVILTTASGVHATNIGEYVLMMMLAFGHRLPRMVEYQIRTEWPSDRWGAFVPRELRGSTVGVLGYGSIGRETARLARAFGAWVLALKRTPELHADTGWHLSDVGDSSGALVERFYSRGELPAMLPECDYVALTLPLTPETRGLIGAPELRLMKRQAVLINIGRGGLVDEAALIEALQNGLLGGAGLDVFQEEPLPPTSPLWKLPNVILSPHISGFTPHYDERAMALFAENLRRYVGGEPLLNQVDVRAGF